MTRMRTYYDKKRKRHEKICDACSKPFISTRIPKIFCSESCKRKSLELMKEAAINVYSNGEQRCASVGCGQCDLDVLNLDHINNDGKNHRDKNGRRMSGHHLYKWLILRDYPEGIQVLCANCNTKKEMERRRALRI